MKFGIEPYEDPAKLKPAYDVLAAALSKKLECPVTVQVVEDYAAEVLAMRNGKLDLGQFGPLGYVFADTKAGAEPLVSFGTAEKELSSYTAGIWVPKDSPIQAIGDLNGKSLALGSVGSTSGDVLPRFGLREAGIADADLTMDYTGGHPEALLALTNGKVDAAEINSQTLATAIAAGTFAKDDFRQVWTSNPIPNDPITVRGDADPAFKQAVKEAFLSLEPADVAKVGEFLDVTPPGPLLEVTKDNYTPLFELAKTMHLTEKDL
ncbi:phosphate/phosphite/phosphonate ABC transporter substrate-binding protein [Paenarthrobacter sp. C1]|uniref:phosphate/phosphite/phosphonate ABC transporter substrate-binding protein n=1 Tax=Paenarthrobacter sp. C1 TaxID=3400220 RepID=UPI003BF5C513